MQLLEPPSNSQLQWTELPSSTALSGAVAALLPAVPRLSKIIGSEFFPSLSTLAFLAQLPAPTELDLFSTEEESRQHMDALLLPLTTPMPCLATFELMLSEVTSAQLTTLLALMPQLHTLVLISLDNEFTRSSFCSRLPYVILCALSAWTSARVELTPAALLEGMRGLQLTHLMLDQSLSAPLDDEQVARGVSSAVRSPADAAGIHLRHIVGC